MAQIADSRRSLANSFSASSMPGHAQHQVSRAIIIDNIEFSAESHGSHRRCPA